MPIKVLLENKVLGPLGLLNLNLNFSSLALPTASWKQYSMSIMSKMFICEKGGTTN